MQASSISECCEKFKHFRWQFNDTLKRYKNHSEMQYNYCPYCGEKVQVVE